ncbi:NYN domain-containing protein [Aeromicrobium sp. zg-636]|uniref:NYN domain-containing protein n=1 Tax=Aeromicrobium senzhongii TaxID=2663859 RepID=A0A8I0K0J5_9ACTN|nr:MULTISPECIES: NYN domain-containing protein [Aeromicrobium]MBC9225863.1 NYN domain-containing protein [Aeromicrobium senzhongii]
MKSTKINRHQLPRCSETGLDRYRDRHQARHGATAANGHAGRSKVTTFACSACGGFHLETLPGQTVSLATPASAEPAAVPTGPRRYVLMDIENLTAGSSTRAEAKALWRSLTQPGFGITSADHVVVGANRHVARKLATSIAGSNVRWVVGAVEPDGADRALLAAINLHHVAKKYDELVIMSGDHAFSELARRAKALGLRVHVVTSISDGRGRSLSRELAAVADRRTTVRHAAQTRATSIPTPAEAA